MVLEHLHYNDACAGISVSKFKYGLIKPKYDRKEYCMLFWSLHDPLMIRTVSPAGESEHVFSYRIALSALSCSKTLQQVLCPC